MKNKNKIFRFSFTGRQAGAIGITYQIFDTYKVDTLGQALYMLYTDYEHIRGLQAWGKEDIPYSYMEWDLIPPETVNATKMITVYYPKREISPETGSYKYYRSDSTENTKWHKRN